MSSRYRAHPGDIIAYDKDVFVVLSMVVNANGEDGTGNLLEKNYVHRLTWRKLVTAPQTPRRQG